MADSKLPRIDCYESCEYASLKEMTDALNSCVNWKDESVSKQIKCKEVVSILADPGRGRNFIVVYCYKIYPE